MNYKNIASKLRVGIFGLLLCYLGLVSSTATAAFLGLVSFTPPWVEKFEEIERMAAACQGPWAGTERCLLRAAEDRTRVANEGRDAAAARERTANEARDAAQQKQSKAETAQAAAEKEKDKAHAETERVRVEKATLNNEFNRTKAEFQRKETEFKENESKLKKQAEAVFFMQDKLASSLSYIFAGLEVPDEGMKAFFAEASKLNSDFAASLKKLKTVPNVVEEFELEKKEFKRLFWKVLAEHGELANLFGEQAVGVTGGSFLPALK